LCYLRRTSKENYKEYEICVDSLKTGNNFIIKLLYSVVNKNITDRTFPTRNKNI
jgi:hypothetical protein